MDSKFLKSLVAKFPKDDGLLYAAAGIFLASMLYIFYNGQLTTILLAVGVALILYALTNDIAVALISGALAGLIAVHYSRTKKEGFEDVVEEEFEEEEEKPKKKVVKKKTVKKAPAPDNGSRGEFFEPGKKYKMPSEKWNRSKSPLYSLSSSWRQGERYRTFTV
jgi:hypothetical protein